MNFQLLRLFAIKCFQICINCIEKARSLNVRSHCLRKVPIVVNKEKKQIAFSWLWLWTIFLFQLLLCFTLCKIIQVSEIRLYNDQFYLDVKYGYWDIHVSQMSRGTWTAADCLLWSKSAWLRVRVEQENEFKKLVKNKRCKKSISN